MHFRLNKNNTVDVPRSRKPAFEGWQAEPAPSELVLRFIHDGTTTIDHGEMSTPPRSNPNQSLPTFPRPHHNSTLVVVWGEVEVVSILIVDNTIQASAEAKLQESASECHGEI